MSLAEPIGRGAQADRKRWSWPKRIAFVIAIAAGMALVGALAIVGYLWLRVPSDRLDPLAAGRLTVTAPTTAPLPVGPFRVEMTAGEQAAITVTRSSDGMVVWRSDPGSAFVEAGVGTVSFTDHLGYFWPVVTRNDRLNDQTVTGARTSGDTVILSGVLSGDNNKATYTFELSPVVKSPEVTALGIHAAVDRTSDGDYVDSVQLLSGRDPDEQIHGLGEQYRPFDLGGTITAIMPREQGIGRGEQPITFMADITNWAGGDLTTTYSAWPTYVTSANRAVTLTDTSDSGAFAVADFTRRDIGALESWAPTLTAQALVADSPKHVVADLAAGQTRPPLADWIQKGAVLGLQGGTDRVLRIVDEMQAAGTRISAVWLQDWTGQRTTSFGDRLWWTWQLDRQRYPHWNRMVRTLHDEHIRVLTYVNPWLVDAAPKGDPDIRNLFDVAETRGYLVKSPEGGPYLVDQNGFRAALVDFTNPRARDWYAEVIAEEVLGVGADGFLADFGEGLPFDAVLAHSTPALQHNRWPQLWAQTVHDGCSQAGQPECVAFMRSSYLGSPTQVPLMWAGDQMVDFSDEDGLASALHGMLSAGVSGMPLWHSDIGGYTSVNTFVKNYVRPPDLNQRWAEMQAFGVVMRTHEGNRPAQNQQVYDTPETRSAFARTTQIYAALHDYRASVIDEATTIGLPAMRHPWLVYPGTAVASADPEFFLGDHLLVAPVTQQGESVVRVTFPPGTWIHVLTGQSYPGDQTLDVPAPLGTPAAFVQQGDPVGDRIRDSLRRAALTTG